MLRQWVISNVFCRRKKTTRHRMQRKVMKDKDRFAMKKTKEKPFNAWINKARVLIYMKEMERLRNINRHHTKYNQKLIKEFAAKTEEYSDYCTHKIFADHKEYMDNVNSLEEVKKEALTLPLYLQKNLGENSDKYSIPAHMVFFNKYYPQLSRFMPKKIAENMIVVYAVQYWLARPSITARPKDKS